MGNDPRIIEQAVLLGNYLATHDKTLIYGAAKIGIMGTIAQSLLDNNGTVIGIIPEFLKTKEVVHTGLSQLITTQNMHQRKLKMQQLSDAFITFPGGIGTLEELFEILTWLQLGLHKKPIGLLNVNGFFNPLIKMLNEMVNSEFVARETLDLLVIDTTIDGLFLKFKNFKPPVTPQWLSEENI